MSETEAISIVLAASRIPVIDLGPYLAI